MDIGTRTSADRLEEYYQLLHQTRTSDGRKPPKNNGSQIHFYT